MKGKKGRDMEGKGEEQSDQRKPEVTGNPFGSGCRDVLLWKERKISSLDRVLPHQSGAVSRD